MGILYPETCNHYSSFSVTLCIDDMAGGWQATLKLSKYKGKDK
jgi:hypothetical protein